MATLTIKATQELDLCGDEYLSDREVEIEFDFSRSVGYVVIAILGEQDIFVARDELKQVLKLLED